MDSTSDQTAAFRAHLTAVGARGTCPVCNRDSWSHNTGYYLFSRTCQCCGHIQTFSPRSVDITLPKPDESPVHRADG